MLMSEFFAPSAQYAPAVPVFGFFFPFALFALSILSLPIVSMSMFSVPSTLSALSILFALIIPVFRSSAPFMLSVLLILFLYTPIPGRQKLIELNGKKMRANSEKLALVYIRQLSSDQLYSSLFFPPSSFVFFSTSRICEKQSFDKAFNINNWPLAKNYTRKKLDISFVGYYCLAAVKANKAW